MFRTLETGILRSNRKDEREREKERKREREREDAEASLSGRPGAGLTSSPF